MCDIIGYSRGVETESGIVTKLFMRGTPRYIAGSRFKYTPEVIDFTYKNLVGAINEAIDKQMAEDGGENFTTDRDTINKQAVQLDFDALIAEFNEIVADFMGKDGEYFGPRIGEIVGKYLGKGKKVNDCSRDQVEQIDLILYDLRTLA